MERFLVEVCCFNVNDFHRLPAIAQMEAVGGEQCPLFQFLVQLLPHFFHLVNSQVHDHGIGLRQIGSVKVLTPVFEVINLKQIL